MYFIYVAWKQCWIGTKAQSVKISPTQLHHQQQPEPLIHSRMDPCFHIVNNKFWNRDEATFFQFSIVQFWCAQVNCTPEHLKAVFK